MWIIIYFTKNINIIKNNKLKINYNQLMIVFKNIKLKKLPLHIF